MIYYITGQTSIDVESTADIQLSDFAEASDLLRVMPEIGVDTETEGFDPFTCNVLLSQFGNEEHQVVVDMATPGAWTFCKQLVEDNKEKVFLFQNAKFDLRFFYKQGIVFPKVFDTYLAESVLYNGIFGHRKGLDALAMRYLGRTLDKSIRGDIHRVGLTYEVIKYGATDVEVLPPIKAAQELLIIEKDVHGAVVIENRFVRALAYAQSCGLGIDHTKWGDKCLQDDKILITAVDLLNEWVIEHYPDDQRFVSQQLDLFSTDRKVNILWSSAKQVAPLFEELGLDIDVKDKKTGKMKKSVEEKVIKPQKSKSTIIPLYLNYSGAAKVVSTYGRSFLKNANPITGRIHTEFNQVLKTGRISSSPNIQNLPAVPKKDKRLKAIYERECVIPRPGNIFIDGDYSGQESIILANFSQDSKLIEFYRTGGGDLHSFVASKVYPDIIQDTPLKMIGKKYPTERQNAKAANFALAYGGNGSTIANNLSISVEIGNKVEKDYFEAFSELKAYFEIGKKAALQRGYILINGLSGRKWFIDDLAEFREYEVKVKQEGFWEKYRYAKKFETDNWPELKRIVSIYFRKKGSIERTSMNAPIQGTAGEQTKLAATYLFDMIVERNLLDTIEIVNLIHDEILLETPVDLAEEWSLILKETMEKAANKFCPIIKMKADPVIDTEWKH